MSDDAPVLCPKCGGGTYRVPIRMGWNITGRGVFTFPDGDFCKAEPKRHGYQVVAGSERRTDMDLKEEDR